jgi:hypothetical protein
MDDSLKENLKKAVEEAEAGLARSLLRWKYRNEGRSVPAEGSLERQSREIAQQAHQILSKRGRNILKGFKGVYSGRHDEDEDPTD